MESAVIRTAILALLLCAMPAHAGRYWFKLADPVTHVTIVYADKVTCAGEDDAFGCYYQIVPNYATIVIRRGLPEYVEKCTLAHERHHAEGWRHPAARQEFLDCGDGSWLSAATLHNMGVK